MSFAFGVDIPNSQDSNLDEHDLDQIVEDSKASNTKKCTSWGMKKFVTWLQKRDFQIDFKTVSEERLNELLRKFYAEVKTEKKGMLTPSALTGIRAALHRTFTGSPYNRNFNILNDRTFKTSNDMFTARCKLYYKTNNRKPKHTAAIEEADMKLLNRYFGDSKNDPVKLQEFVWFALCFHFGRRGREGWRELKSDHFIVKTDTEGKRYVTTNVTESTKNNPGGSKQKDQDYSDVRMYEVKDSSLDPVSTFVMYITKLNAGNINLFQKPKKIFSEESGWYTQEVLGKNTLSNMMKVLSNKARLSQIYTNHCARASTVTTLYRAGVDTQRICSVTKHKNESTLAHYISSASDKQKAEMSDILNKAMDVEMGNDVGVFENKTTEQKTIEIQVLFKQNSNLLQSHGGQNQD